MADLLGLTTAAAIAYLLTHGGIGFDPLLLALPAWGVLAGFYGLYKRDRVGADNATLDEVWPIFNCVTVASFAVFAVVQAGWPSSLHGGRVVAFWALAAVAIPAYRSIARTLLRRQLALKQRAVVVGAGLVGQEIARKVLRQPSYGLDLVGFVDPNPLQLHDELQHLPVLGSTDDLAELLVTNDIDHVVLAFTADHQAGLDVVRVCNEMGVQVDIVPRLFEVVGSRAAVYSLEGTPLLGLTPPMLGASHRFAKRAMDVMGAIFGLVVLSPLFLACAIAIKLNSDGSIFFRQVADRARPEAVHDRQVPHDGGRRRGAQGRGGAPERALRARRRPHVQDPRRSPPDLGRAVPAQVLDRRVPAALERPAAAR